MLKKSKFEKIIDFRIHTLNKIALFDLLMISILA